MANVAYGPSVDFDDVVNGVVTAVEVVGIAVLVIGAVSAFATSGAALLRHRSDDGSDPYGDLRRNLARVILLGLEVLILADIIRTIVVDQTLQNVLVLGVVVLIRIVLSWSLQVEIEGAWPWQRFRLVGGGEPGGTDASGGTDINRDDG